MTLRTIFTILTLLLLCSATQHVKAQVTHKNIIQAKASFGGYTGLNLGLNYERLLTEKHRVSFYAEARSRYFFSTGIGYKYQFLRYKNFELLGGLNAGYARLDYNLTGGGLYHQLIISPTAELRYNINDRFQILLSAQKSFYKNKADFIIEPKITAQIGVGYKF